MSRILITGALGAVGTPLWKTSRSSGVTRCGAVTSATAISPNTLLALDVGDYRQLAGGLRRAGFDYVYHAAAEFGRNNGEDFYETLWRTNAIGTKNMLRLQEQHRFRMSCSPAARSTATGPS